ncbi:MAG: lysozyme inhibitor LprI family protein [Alcanivoracaceae bacterium]|nr:lysozyme inhibitor LprI family protein [Alcanivoracaceae bacterium]
MRWSFLLFLSVVMTGCGSDPEPQPKDPLAVWQPDLNGPIAEMEELLQTLNQQSHINRVSANLAVLHDAKLYQIYINQLAGLSGEQRSEFRKEQRQWLKKRDKVVREAADQFRSGSIAAFIGHQAFIDETRLRVELLELQRE